LPSRHRVASSGSERAEYEHIFGALETDPQDPRFVLVDDETEQRLRNLPPGIPPNVEQSPSDKNAIFEAIASVGDDGKPTSTPGASKVSDKAVIASGVKPDNASK
jgi:hypothetical protein